MHAGWSFAVTLLTVAAGHAHAGECQVFLEQLRDRSSTPVTSEELVERPTLRCEQPDCTCAPQDDDGSRLVVCAHGPGGSGRFWTVHVATLDAAGKITEYLQTVTTTVGWRGIRNYPGDIPIAPIPWLSAGDSNRKHVVNLWWSASFGEHTGAENLLFVTAHRFEGGKLVPVRAGGSKLLDALAAMYRRLSAVPKNRRQEAVYLGAVEAIEAWRKGTTCEGQTAQSKEKAP